MSDTELVDIVCVRSDGIVLWVDKERSRKDAQWLADCLNRGVAGRQYVTAPCGRFAKGDKYVAGDE